MRVRWVWDRFYFLRTRIVPGVNAGRFGKDGERWTSFFRVGPVEFSWPCRCDLCRHLPPAEEQP